MISKRRLTLLLCGGYLKIPNCIIFGSDGLDADVTKNLQRLFVGFGYRVTKSIGQIPENFTEVLVIARSNSMDKYALIKSKVSALIIYDYAAESIDNFEYLSHLDKKIKKVIFISTCEDRITALRNIHKKNRPDIVYHHAFLPVFPKLWIEKRVRERWPYPIHVGNFKELDDIDKNDPYLLFLKFIRREKVLVGGQRWHGYLPSSQRLGGLKLNTVSSVYASHSFAVGIMYPYQRSCTYSGRFWQAPLNGCVLLSETTVYGKKIPGIYEVDFGKTVKELNEEIDFDSKTLMLESRIYWNAITEDHIHFLSKKLPTFKLKGYLQIFKFTCIHLLSKARNMLLIRETLRKISDYHLTNTLNSF